MSGFLTKKLDIIGLNSPCQLSLMSWLLVVHVSKQQTTQ